MKGPAHILRRLWHRSTERRRRSRFARALRHLHGPTQDAVPEGEVLAVFLIRNGAYFLDALFDYYRALGINHFAFIDNGSTDGTLARIKAEPGTIIDECHLPLSQFEDLMRAYPAQTYGQNRWCLYVDMDEIFDFPGRAKIGLKGLLSYLEAQNATAMVCQMLDMFGKGPLRASAQLTFEQSIQEQTYFDVSTVDKFPYHSPDIPFSELLKPNSVPNADIAFCFGGVRGKVFGENCCLTKHPLIFNGPEVSPGRHPHLSMGVRCADITGVLKHYKFAGDTVGRDTATVRSGEFAHGEDAARIAAVSEAADLTLFSLDARAWNRAELLVRAGFLVGSPAYDAFVEGYAP